MYMLNLLCARGSGRLNIARRLSETGGRAKPRGIGIFIIFRRVSDDWFQPSLTRREILKPTDRGLKSTAKFNSRCAAEQLQYN